MPVVSDIPVLIFFCVWLFNRYIGNMRRGESESAEEFAARVQVASAASLSVKTTNHTVADKVGRLRGDLFILHRNNSKIKNS